MSRKDDPYSYGYVIYRRRTHLISWIFLGIFIVIAIFIPLFGMNLRYQVGTIFHQIFTILGEICIYGGWILLGFTAISIIGTHRLYIKSLAFSIILLWIGAFLTGQAFELFGFIIGNHEPPSGFHQFPF
jgi:hypothetical protein